MSSIPYLGSYQCYLVSSPPFSTPSASTTNSSKEVPRQDDYTVFLQLPTSQPISSTPFFCRTAFCQTDHKITVVIEVSEQQKGLCLLFFDIPGYMSGVIVSTIAIVRFIAVKHPFYMVRNKPLFLYLFAVFLFYIWLHF